MFDPKKPRCPWCHQPNNVNFPRRGHDFGWYSNKSKENPNAAYVLNVVCSHCKKQFVIEWDTSPL